MKDEVRDKLTKLLNADQPLPQALIDQWNKLTGSFIGA